MVNTEGQGGKVKLQRWGLKKLKHEKDLNNQKGRLRGTSLLKGS